ncbi:MAG: hypothetical protein V8T44_11285 [Odoribacter splanchnicus]
MEHSVIDISLSDSIFLRISILFNDLQLLIVNLPPPIFVRFSKPSKDAKEFKEEEDLAFTSKSPPMLFKPLKPLKEDKDFKEEELEDSAITLKFPPIVSRLSKPSKDSKAC